ncbi:MAG: HK97 family phage prohead protease [Alphaproteobacteria bacterium]|nr:HK97 family phage prohead protease [Alphaproteobacteria bacterium]
MSLPLRVKTLGGDGVFAGYASVFGELDQQNEIVAAGAFARTLAKWRRQGRAPALLWMHDPTQPIGIWQSIREDKSGLLVEGRLALRTQKGAEAYELLKLGALTGLSIGYRVVASQIDAKRKARVLTDVDLFEVSLVTFPANEAARVSEVKKGDQGSAFSIQEKKNVDSTLLSQAAERLRKAARSLTDK